MPAPSSTASLHNLEREHPRTNAGRGVRIEPFHAWLTSGIDQPLGVVFALVMVLLAIAAANVTSLQLGATLGRRSEVAVRGALGAGRRRIASQFLIEHTMLALAGAVVGVALSAALVPMVVREARETALLLFGLDRVRIDARVLGFAILTALAAGLASGVAPGDALVASIDRRGAAVGVSRRTSNGSSRRMRAGLVIAEVALSSILLVAGALLMRSYWQLLHAPVGFNGEHVLSLEYRLPRNKYPTPIDQAAFHDEVLRQARTLPGAQHAAAVRALPFSGNSGTVSYLTDLAASDAAAQPAAVNTVTDDYFTTLQIPLLAGRPFGPQDRSDTAPVVIVSRSICRRGVAVTESDRQGNPVRRFRRPSARDRGRRRHPAQRAARRTGAGGVRRQPSESRNLHDARRSLCDRPVGLARCPPPRRVAGGQRSTGLEGAHPRRRWSIDHCSSSGFSSACSPSSARRPYSLP